MGWNWVGPWATDAIGCVIDEGNVLVVGVFPLFSVALPCVGSLGSCVVDDVALHGLNEFTVPVVVAVTCN